LSRNGGETGSPPGSNYWTSDLLYRERFDLVTTK
jgi:hypothetical protein